MDVRNDCFWIGGLTFIVLLCVGCDSQVASNAGEVDAAQAFTEALQFSNPDVRCVPKDVSTPEPVLPGGAASAVLLPGEGVRIDLPTASAGGGHALIDFGGDCAFEVPITDRGTLMAVDATLLNDVCQRLSAVCHDISCSETVYTSEGTISSSEAMKLVLACNPDGCDGTSVQGCAGACQAGEACLNGQCVDAAAANSCAKRVPVCCPDRNDQCDANFGGCYCDAFCMEAGDCCDDACVRCGFCE